MKALSNLSIQNKNTFAKVLFGYFIALFVFRFHSGTFLIFQYQQPMKGPNVDWSFWLSLCTGFPHFIIRHYWACLLVDSAVVIFSIASFFSNKWRNLFCIALLIFFFIQRITLETYACSHSKSTAALFIALLPFCFKNEKNFKLISEFSRYFLLYILIASAFYKLYNGGILSPENFAVTLVNQHSDLATLNPQHISYSIASILITHPFWAGIAYIALFLTQGIFVVGIFTRKYDTLLFVALLIFSVMTYLVMRIYNMDITVLGLWLLYNKKHLSSTNLSSYNPL